MEQQELKQNLSNRKQWGRVVYMLLFALVLYPVMSVLSIVVMVQILFALFTGSVNGNIQKFSVDLTRYINQIILFLTYNENTKPFPFSAWQQVDAEDIEMEADEHESVIDVTPRGDETSKDDSKPSD